VRAPEEARALARKAFELILCRYTGQLTEEQHRALARGLEALLLPPPRRERKPFIPPPRQRLVGEGAEGVRKRSATGQELKGKISVKIPVNPSLLPSLSPLLYRLVLRGYVARLRIVRLHDLQPLKPLLALLPPLARAGGKVVRIELEVSR